MIGQWTYHPAGGLYEGKYVKIYWEDNDGIVLRDLYWGYDTEEEAVAASTDPEHFSWASMNW